MKPILFNTEMVRAILDGRKMVTRRLIKPQPPLEMPSNHNICKMPILTNKGFQSLWYMDVIEQRPFKRTRYFEKIAPYEPGNILYVRETWAELETVYGHLYYAYKADDDTLHHSIGENFTHWHPSIHMPKEAARIFLRVTYVRVERLQDSFFKSGSTIFTLLREGIDIGEQCRDCIDTYGSPCCIGGESECGTLDEVRSDYSDLWNSTIKKSDLDKYGWNANPWVGVIEFERISKEEALKTAQGNILLKNEQDTYH